MFIFASQCPLKTYLEDLVMVLLFLTLVMHRLMAVPCIRPMLTVCLSAAVIAEDICRVARSGLALLTEALTRCRFSE